MFRNSESFHLVNEEIISMPHKWEYPLYAARDLAFHTLPFSIVEHTEVPGQVLADKHLQPCIHSHPYLKTRK